MNKALRIVVADDEPEMVKYLEETLAHLGHEVVGSGERGDNSLRHASRLSRTWRSPTSRCLIWTGSKPPHELCRSLSIPVVLVSAYHDPDLIERAMADQVMAYLIKPIKQAELETTIALAVRRFKEFTALQQQATDLRQALEDRKIIERAKGILMKRAGLDEADAFRRLQKLSSDKNLKLVRIAEMIVTADEAMQ